MALSLVVWGWLVTISLSKSATDSSPSNWITQCQSSDQDLTDVCLHEFNEWIQIFRQHPLFPDTQLQPSTSRQIICPTSRIWKSLVLCACDKCHHTFFLPEDLSVIWTKSQCNMTNLNASVDLCKWIKLPTDIGNTTESHVTIPELEHKMQAILVHIHRCKSAPTVQNIQQFLHLFHQIIDAIISIHLSTNSPHVLKQWLTNVTDTFEAYKDTESKIKSEEEALKDGLKSIESKEYEMIEDLQILQQLENHFNIPRAQVETHEILKKFKDLLSGIEEIHDEHMMNKNTNTDAKKMEIFWSKGLRKLKMAVNILAVISNETESIHKKLNQHQLSLNKVKNIETKIETDLQDDQHRLLLKETKEFHQIMDEMSAISESQSYHQAISTMEQLSNEWKKATERIVTNIAMIEVKLSDVLQHMESGNSSEPFRFDEYPNAFVETQTKVDINAIFKDAWHQEMKIRHINRSNVSLKYDDASIDEAIHDHASDAMEMMANKTLVYGWSVFVGAIVLCFSFFMYLK